MAKDANANHIRLHAQVYPEFFLDIADEVGMLITDETAIWGSHCRYHYSMEFIENSKKHVERLIKRDRNHPSVILWSIGNEEVMIQWTPQAARIAQRLQDLCHKLDPTRPVTLAICFWNPAASGEETVEHTPPPAAVLDVMGFNYAVSQWERLCEETLLFKNALFSSTLPPEVLDAVSANISILKSPTCLRLESGAFYGFEGCHCDSGCCEGSCTHVWAYTYAIPFLFPRLERSMRSLEYAYNMNPNGGMSFRLMLPPGRSPMQFRPCVDGQYATVMRVWREYKISGDKAWLKSLWPEIKRSIEFAWSPDNTDRWDPNKDGIMEGRQHHTLDMELFGENAWLSGLYLGGLKAGANIARELGDGETAEDYERVYESGREKLNRELYNGEYFIQKIDLGDRSVLDPYAGGARSLQNQDVYAAYWNDEKKEILYQIADGCGIDQVLAQWHANLIGLGEIFDHDKAVSALKSIYKHNYVPSMREHFNPCRLYALNDEAGTIICAWPKETKLPAITIVYAEETMHGFEYQAAIHMIQEGMVEEGLRMVRAVRERYDGEKRNPWNEIECGSNYARSMASYALLLTFSGFRYDVPKGLIGFHPIGDLNNFKSLWSLDGGWGQVSFEADRVRLTLSSGSIQVKTLELSKAGRSPKAVAIDGKPVSFAATGDVIELSVTPRVERELTVEYA
jgi:hypothetical protein